MRAPVGNDGRPDNEAGKAEELPSTPPQEKVHTTSGGMVAASAGSWPCPQRNELLILGNKKGRGQRTCVRTQERTKVSLFVRCVYYPWKRDGERHLSSRQRVTELLLRDPKKRWYLWQHYGHLDIMQTRKKGTCTSPGISYRPAIVQVRPCSARGAHLKSAMVMTMPSFRREKGTQHNRRMLKQTRHVDQPNRGLLFHQQKTPGVSWGAAQQLR